MYSDNQQYYANNDNQSGYTVNNNHSPIKKITKIISFIVIMIIIVFIVLTILSNFKLIRLPWIDYPETLSLSQSEIVLKKDNNYHLTSTVYPTQIPHGKIIYSSSDPSVVTVNELTGYIEAKKNGVVKITAKLEDYGDIYDTCDVIVSDNVVFIEKITVNNETINMLEGKEQNLAFTYEPNSASVHNFIYSSSDEDVVKVDANGKMTAVKKGTAIITITDKMSDVSATQTVNVFENQTIEKIEVSNDDVTLVVDGTIQLYASVKPSNANQRITWSSVDEKIATVTSGGLVTGVNYGETKIIATAVDGTNAIVNVKVQDKTRAVEGVSINQNDFSLDVGKTKRLTVKITPSNATDQKVSWSSNNPNIVTVNNNGDVKGIAPGTATITVKTISGGFTASVNVTVKKVQIIKETDIQLSIPKSSLYVGKSTTIQTKILPANATYKDLKWTSSNPNVATVSNGTIYGKGEGVATIKVTSHHGLYKSFVVRVSSISVSGISLSDSNRKINIGEQYALIATITPSDATYKKVTWSSSDNSIISVNEKGVVTPHKVGRATITATSTNGKKASCAFTVTNNIIMPTSVKINKSQIEVKENGKMGLTAVVQPSNATNQKVTWTVENGNLASVNDQGIITGVSDGITRVTATTVNGKSSTAFVVIKTNNKSKFNYLEGTTIKYWIENNTSKNVYITHIWVKDAYNQFATMLPAKFPGLATASTLMKRVASKYPNKTAVGVNASGFVSYNYKNNSGFGGFLAKSNKAWNYTPVTPVVIFDGNVKRDLTNTKMPNSNHVTYGLKKDGNLAGYYFSIGSDIEKNVEKSKKIKNDGIKYTFGFNPILVVSGGKRQKLKTTKDIRQGLCQIDKYNFVIYTNISNDRSKGFSFSSLADLMVSDKCITGFNLDGGGSTNLMYKKKDSKSVTNVRTTSRSIADIIYFYGD